MKRWTALALLAGACGQPATAPDHGPGARLEAAAMQAGLVVDAARAPLTGAWALDTDRACIIPASDGRERIGLLVDYGEGQGCAAAGVLARDGDRLAIDLGDCRIAASFDGRRIAFPAELPAACDRFCTGRASLAAMTVERQSGSVSEAVTLRTPSGRTLCTAD